MRRSVVGPHRKLHVARQQRFVLGRPSPARSAHRVRRASPRRTPGRPRQRGVPPSRPSGRRAARRPRTARRPGRTQPAASPPRDRSAASSAGSAWRLWERAQRSVPRRQAPRRERAQLGAGATLPVRSPWPAWSSRKAFALRQRALHAPRGTPLSAWPARPAPSATRIDQTAYRSNSCSSAVSRSSAVRGGTRRISSYRGRDVAEEHAELNRSVLSGQAPGRVEVMGIVRHLGRVDPVQLRHHHAVVVHQQR